MERMATRSTSDNGEQDYDTVFEAAVAKLSAQKKTDTQNVVLGIVNIMRQQKAELEASNEQITILKNQLDEKQTHIDMLEGRVTSLEHESLNLHDKLVELTGRSMDKNIIINGLEDAYKEDLEKKVNKVFTDDLKSEKTISIDVCHRNGPFVRAPAGKAQRPRPVTVMFRTRSDKMHILSLRKNLPKETDISLVAQRPEQIRTSQAILFEEQKRYKKDHPNTKTKVVGERFMIEDGPVLRDLHKERHRAYDKDVDVVEVAKTLSVRSTGEFLHEESGSRFQGHVIEITDESQLRAAFVRLKQTKPVAKATHNAWALRLAGGREFMSDNWEFGAARKIVDVLRKKKVTGYVCVVSRWFMGKHMGPDRFSWYENAASEACAMATEDIP